MSKAIRAAIVMLSMALAGCMGAGGNPAAYQPTATASPAGLNSAAPVSQSYRLGSGDKLRVIVFGEQDLSGEFELDANGDFSLPLVGQINAGGKTARDVEQAIGARLSQGYLKNPSVSVEILNYRPFYIHGEVKSAGEYPYSNGLTLQAAVAKAGGYTYRADMSTVYIRRANESAEMAYNLDRPVNVLPGDTVRVGERFF